MLGESIPSNTEHAISVSLPTWRSNVGYEENEDWVVSRMRSGYPRFFIHPEIKALECDILSKYGLQGELCMLFPSAFVASACKDFIASQSRARTGTESQLLESDIRIIALSSPTPIAESGPRPDIWVVFVVQHLYHYAKEFWQHTGDGISSRRAAFVHSCLSQGHLLDPKAQDNQALPGPQLPRGPSRYSRHSVVEPAATETSPNSSSSATKGDRGVYNFVELRYGRNLETVAIQQARLAIQQRIVGIIQLETSAIDDAAKAQNITTSPDDTLAHRRTHELSANDVYLFPTGMSAIFNSHRILRQCFGSYQMVEFGFPYLDTLKVLQKFGGGCIFFGNGDEDDVDQLQNLLQNGERIIALFCEFPSNPLLKSPNLTRLRTLANQYKFVIVVDETIGNFINVDVLPYADILVSSLTKIFSGDSNVMGGSCIVNPKMPYYAEISKMAANALEDNYWDEDIIFMERNSRDFTSRALRINSNAEALADLFLKWQPSIVKRVYYPKYDGSRTNYDNCKCSKGGYGGLLSITFSSPEYAIKFYDLVDTAKGPSLGTNFTLVSPYTLLAHYNELDWVAQYGVESHLVRISVGLEQTATLVSKFENALQQVAPMVSLDQLGSDS
ncbi:hypothetical protein DRE_06330 [Drechslerella stenobrocha 248]|uniref:cystathionine gamma-synthase n=1 Tax=Drechslerella stenobrocha 248 TaxID=1043628 RepID=W7I7V5_9PEZI|nr:hypothetical protein DRE_06330 [Drechslerella stenobrocha 248]